MLARASRKPSLTLLGAVALVVAIANPAAAPPGDLDTTFDSDGQATTSEHSGGYAKTYQEELAASQLGVA